MFITGIFMSVFGSVTFISFLSILSKVTSNPRHYRFRNGFDENTLAVLAILAFAIAVTGIVLMIFGWVKRKNQNMLDTMQNQAKQNFCPNCKVAVESKDGKCPICGRSLN